MKLIIVSELVGKVGEEFIPTEGINVDALIEGGFIRTEKPKTNTKSED